MTIINDCIKEGTLKLEVNGQCRDVSNVIKKMEECCIIVNRKVDSITNKVKILEQQLEKCCKTKVTVVGGPIKPIKGNTIISISYVLTEGIPRNIPYNFRNLEYLKRHPNTDWFGPKNTKYYSDKEKEALVQNIRRVNPTYGMKYVLSSNGVKYLLKNDADN